MTPRVRLAVIWSLASLCVIASILVSAAITSALYQNKVPPRTVIAGVALGGLDEAKAYQVIAQKRAELTEATIPIVLGEKQEALTLTELGIELEEPTVDKLGLSSNRWDWLALDYWQRFFSRKSVELTYRTDEAKIKDTLNQVFGITINAEDAKLLSKDGELVVSPSRPGTQLVTDTVLVAVAQLVETGATGPALISASEVQPSISDEEATQTKADISGTLQPIYLSGEGKSFTISVADLQSLISYETQASQLSWKIDDEKLKSYLTSKIANKVNVKMVQKSIQSDTQEVVQEGRDGKVLDTAKLVVDVKRTITERAQTKGSPIQLSVSTIAFTEKIVSPDYIAGLFEGLYVDVNLAKQRMYIMNGTSRIQTFLISSGKPGMPTPVGLFYVKNKIELAQSRLYPGIWMRKWNALATSPDGSGYKGYGIHDLPCFDKDCNSVEGASHLGSPVSHGCIRLGHDNAVWFYENIPVGTPINIHR